MRSGTRDLSRPKYHVLLIGIDAYDRNASLQGCVNDIDAIQKILLERVGVLPEEIHRLASPLDDRTNDEGGRIREEPATLANMRKALAELGSDLVQPDHRVFFYYSGHGTQVQLQTPDGARFVREALVPSDFVILTKTQYLFDWEINEALSAIAARTEQITVILDACCSGGATRDTFDPPGGRVRFLRTTTPHDLEGAPTGALHATMRGVASGLRGAVSACEVVTACLDDERAREASREGSVPHGELTRALVAQIERLPREIVPDLSWSRIWRATQAEVARWSPAQHPRLTGGFARRVFGGPRVAGTPGCGVQPKGDVFEIDVGEVGGITPGARLAVYGLEPASFEVDPDKDRRDRKGILEVIAAEESTSVAKAISSPGDMPPGADTPLPFELPEGARAKVIALGSEAHIKVALEPPDAAIAADLAKSSLLTVAAPGARGDVTLVKRGDGGWAVTDDVFGAGETPGEPVLVVIPPKKVAAVTRQIVEHYHAYSAPLRLAKRCTDLPDALVVRLLDCNNLPPLTEEQAQDPSKVVALVPEARPGAGAPYVLQGGRVVRGAQPVGGVLPIKGGDKIAVLVENTSDVDLYVTMIVCEGAGEVWVTPAVEIGAHAKRIFWNDDTIGRAFHLWLVDGKTLAVDRLVFVGTNNPRATLDHLQTDDTFQELLERERAMRPPKVVVPELWTATTTAYRVEAAQ